MHDLIQLGQAEPVLKRIADATQSLLGCTIALTEEQWLEPSLLPGWTRAHVAAHLARNADALSSVARAAAEGDLMPLYPSNRERVEAIERGSEQSAVDLQIDLDTSAGQLAATLDAIPDWTVPVQLPGGIMPLAALPVARLHEIYLHLRDLRCPAFSVERIDTVPATWLLQWVIDRLQNTTGVHSVEIISSSGLIANLGPGPQYLRVQGTDAALWEWLTGRSDGAKVLGSRGLTWPLLD